VIEPAQRMARGDAPAALAAAPHRLSGRFAMGGQDHFYLEGQVAVATPHEHGQVHVLSSTQHPSEVQHLVAKVLGLTHADVTAAHGRRLRRQGDAGRAVRLRGRAGGGRAAAAGQAAPDRDDDMVITGKRHDFDVDYDVGFDDEAASWACRATMLPRRPLGRPVGPVMTTARCATSTTPTGCRHVAAGYCSRPTP
jgi:xanthine dehydrogenase large subunit